MYENPAIWVTWGQQLVHHAYFLRAREELYRRLAKYNPDWRRLGKRNATGHPWHASRLDYSWRLLPFDTAGWTRRHSPVLDATNPIKKRFIICVGKAATLLNRSINDAPELPDTCTKAICLPLQRGSAIDF